MSDGPLLRSVRAARRMLRDCHQWQRLVSADTPWDEVTAEAHIHFDGLPPPDPGPDHSRSELEALRPFALVWADQAGGLRLRSESAGNCCPIHSGAIVVQIELPVLAGLANDPTLLAEDIMRKLGRIVRTGDAAEPGLFELSGLAGYLPLTEIQFTGYVRTDTKSAVEIGDAVVAEMRIAWGQDS
ncbi:hypothetical protein [Aureliella helgolandensis]|uniref:Uncharacterized protein n=1 Tax=Aureliella helgolandensis TaxID=2527968 RepID=A0A518G2V9_9BACT|nr:hypothetical protein [Aureliella helgolandensis]QDV22922.1 hypothetical protein Q31a_12150 [Aureliella helgolandensis]